MAGTAIHEKEFGAAQFLPPSTNNTWFVGEEEGFESHEGRVETPCTMNHVSDTNDDLVAGSASLGSTKTVIFDLPAGGYDFTVEGYLALAPENWIEDVEKCPEVPLVAVALGHFVAHPSSDGVRLAWAASPLVL